MTQTAHERALQAARALRERQPATLLLWRLVSNLSHGLLLPALALWMLVALLSYSPSDPAWSHTSSLEQVAYQNALGVSGAWFADIGMRLFGSLVFALPILLLLTSAFYWLTKRQRLEPVYVGLATMVVRFLGLTFAFFTVLLCGSLLVYALIDDPAGRQVWLGMVGGGWGEGLASLGAEAAFFIVVGMVSLSITMLFDRSYYWLLDAIGWPFIALFNRAVTAVNQRQAASAEFERRAFEREEPIAFTETAAVTPVVTESLFAATQQSEPSFSALDEPETDLFSTAQRELDEWGDPTRPEPYIGELDLEPDVAASEPAATAHISAQADTLVLSAADTSAAVDDELAELAVTQRLEPIVAVDSDEDTLDSEPPAVTSAPPSNGLVAPVLSEADEVFTKAAIAQRFKLDDRAIGSLQLSSDTQRIVPLLNLATPQYSPESDADDTDYAADTTLISAAASIESEQAVEPAVDSASATRAVELPAAEYELVNERVTAEHVIEEHGSDEHIDIAAIPLAAEGDVLSAVNDLDEQLAAPNDAAMAVQAVATERAVEGNESTAAAEAELDDEIIDVAPTADSETDHAGAEGEMAAFAGAASVIDRFDIDALTDTVSVLGDEIAPALEPAWQPLQPVQPALELSVAASAVAQVADDDAADLAAQDAEYAVGQGLPEQAFENALANQADTKAAFELPPLLEETLSGPLQAIPLLDQTLIEPLAETATHSFRVEVDEFSHVDYDDEAYSSPLKRTNPDSHTARKPAFDWAHEAVDTLEELHSALAQTVVQSPQPMAADQHLAASTVFAASGLAHEFTADSHNHDGLNDSDESDEDSLAAALDALAQTSMFRAEALAKPPAKTLLNAEPDADLIPAKAESGVVRQVDSQPVAQTPVQSVTALETTSECDSQMPASVEAQLSQTAKLLAADLAQSLQLSAAEMAAATAALSSQTVTRATESSPELTEPMVPIAPAPAVSAPSVLSPQAGTSSVVQQSAPNVVFDDVAPRAIEPVEPAVSPAPVTAAPLATSEPQYTAATQDAAADAPRSSHVTYSAPPLLQHPQAGPVIPVNPALAVGSMAASQAASPQTLAPHTTASAVTASPLTAASATPSQAGASSAQPLADTINFSAARPASLHGSFDVPSVQAAADGLPVASADNHSFDIFASDPSIRRLSHNCSTAVNVGDVGLPSLDLLRRIKEHERKGFSEAALLAMAKLLEEKLADFGVEIKVANVLPGPVITRFEVLPAPGIKASRISGLSTDLARSLAVDSVRVLEVIPGTSCVGIEVPNAEREMVFLGDVLVSEEYQNATDPLTIALGYDISGQPAVANLGKMPHLLVAGTTGSGKSVGVNTMLLSMLFKASPEDVRLILVDPKFLELSVYEGIPHLLTPVITDMNEAANALRWAVGEMERRYQLMSKLGVRNLAGYNQKVLAAEQAGSPLEDPIWQVDPDDTSASKYVRPYLCKLPSIVIVIDEFADMMMIAGKKCETLITRIAQKARAAGIHLVLATQRPSVDVITGLIKANIPSRIAFTVSTKIDSRTILDQSGAEELLGAGDMLYAPSNSRTVMRVHGAFVSDDEVHAVIEDWRSRAEPNYLHSILEEQSGVSVPGLVDDTPAGADGNRPEDALYDQVLDFILTTRKASISAVQRRFGIGYNRSAKIIESMEAAGILGPAGTGAGNSRDILIGTHDE